MLRLLDIVNTCLTKDKLKLRSRSKIINNFQNEIENETIKILIRTYILSFVDLNLQKNCRNVHLFDFFSSHEIDVQIVEKNRKIDQIRTIIVIHYYLSRIINNAQIWRNIQKIFLAVLAQLNMRIFEN